MRTIKTTTISILVVGLLAGSAVGVAAQDEEAARHSTGFTGAMTTQIDIVHGGEVTARDGLDYTNGIVIRKSMVSSDPRLTGEVTITGNWLFDPAGQDPDAEVFSSMLNSATLELSNDGGSWLGEVTGFSSVDLQAGADMMILVGRDGYEGLTAYADLDNSVFPEEYFGVIFPAAMPEFPEPYTAE